MSGIETIDRANSGDTGEMHGRFYEEGDEAAIIAHYFSSDLGITPEGDIPLHPLEEETDGRGDY